jgi:hypothetical protein
MGWVLEIAEGLGVSENNPSEVVLRALDRYNYGFDFRGL